MTSILFVYVCSVSLGRPTVCGGLSRGGGIVCQGDHQFSEESRKRRCAWYMICMYVCVLFLLSVLVVCDYPMMCSDPSASVLGSSGQYSNSR